MDSKTLLFFNAMPEMLPVYEAVEQAILSTFSGVTVKVDKTQITFRTKYGFAFVSLPFRRKKDWPKKCLILSFGLDHEVKNARIAVATQPYPNRWTHHVLLQRPDEVDGEIMEWLRQAYVFSFR